MSAPHETLRVTTADNVPIGYRVAGLATRVTAALLDLLIAGLVIAVAEVLIFAIVTGIQVPVDQGATVLSLGVILMIGVGFLVLIAYFTIVLAVTGGRGPGKSALGLRVIRADGSAPRFSDCLLRSLALVPDLLGPGPVLMFLHPTGRRLGDLLAGTVVVLERTPVTLLAAAMPSPVYVRNPEPGPAVDGLDHLGDREFEAVRTFLSRPGLLPEQRARLAGLLAAKLLDRMALDPGAPERRWPPELLLERIYLQLAPVRER